MKLVAEARIGFALLLVAVTVVAIGVYLILQTWLPANNPELSPSSQTTPSPSLKPSLTPSPTTKISPTHTPTPTLLTTPTPTVTPTATPAPTISIPTPIATPPPTPAPTPVPTPTLVINATNWAGYVVASNLQNPQPTVTGVSASWIVPAVVSSVGDTFSAVWIGIGGQFDRTIIQCGTEQDSLGGQLRYSAWYELLPRTAVSIRGITVSPGDQMWASIQLVNATLNEWSINLTDVTTGRSFQNTFVYASSQLSAEWIVERPTVNNVISSLANFGNLTFTDCTVSFDSAFGVIGSFPFSPIAMYSSTAPGSGVVQLADASGLSVEGAGFTVSYLASG